MVSYGLGRVTKEGQTWKGASYQDWGADLIGEGEVQPTGQQRSLLVYQAGTGCWQAESKSRTQASCRGACGGNWRQCRQEAFRTLISMLRGSQENYC